MRAAHLVGERKVLTILFADVVNSTALARQVGAEDWAAIMNQAFDRLCPVIEHAGGTLARLMGDAVLAFFGAPLAHDEDPLRGVSAALDLLKAAHDYASEVRAAYSVEFAVRVGVSTGPVVVGDIGSDLLYEYTAMGDAVNLAARLQGAASPSTALIAEATYLAVRGAVRCVDQGQLEVKGLSEPVHVYRALELIEVARWTRDGAIGRSVQLVGRVNELATIRAHVDRLHAGTGGLVVVTGDAGVGKSRLLSEVRQVATDAGCRWLQGHAVSFGQTVSYWPFAEMLRGAVDATELDTPSAIWVKLLRWAREVLGPEADELVPYLGVLLALDVPEVRLQPVPQLATDSLGPQLFRALRRLVHALAVERPTVLALEDVHWFDNSTCNLLEHLLPLVSQSPLLVIASARPEPSPALNRLSSLAASHPANVCLTVEPLSDEESQYLIARLLDTDELPPGLFPLIHAKAEGNAFFTEEIVRSLIEQHALERESNGLGWQTTEPTHQIVIPNTIQGVLQARMDRLEPQVRDTLRLASVIGRTFFHQVLAAVASDGSALDSHLERLAVMNLIRIRRRLPDLEFVFKHALIQEAAYESILVNRRRELHGLVAASIETLFADRLDEFYAVLAYHYGRAEQWDKARHYLSKAGDQAARLAADGEALAHYQQALVIHERIGDDRWNPVERAALEHSVGQALMRRADYAAAREYLQHAIRRVGGRYPDSGAGLKLAMLVQVARQATHRLAPIHLATSRNPPTDGAAEERPRIYADIMQLEYLLDLERSAAAALLALNDAEASGVPYGIALGSFSVGLLCDTLGAFGWAGRYHRRAVETASGIDDPRLLGMAYFAHAYHQMYIGHWKSALEGYQRAADILWRVGELRVWAIVRMWACFLTSWRDNFAIAIRQLDEIIQVAADSGDGAPRAWALGFQGYLLALRGDLDAGIRALEGSLEFMDRLPDYHGAVSARGNLARCFVWRGELEKARAVVDVARASITRHKVRGLSCTSLLLAEAEADLLTAERASGPEKRGALHKAERTCRRAIAGGELDSAGRPAAYRAAGTCAWLRGKPTEARRLWQISLDAARFLESTYELGLTLLERGSRTAELAEVGEAAALFNKCGAELAAFRAREVLYGECSA
jgi:class 3 adenylate cyclase/tetratricopeptide (TPR) repeat protein